MSKFVIFATILVVCFLEFHGTKGGIVPSAGWFTVWNGYQYVVTDRPRSWHESRTWCRARGAQLASVGMRNYWTRRALKRLLHEDQMWIGLTDINHEGWWRWEDGTTSDPSNTEWNSGEPNNVKGREDCGELSREYSYRVNDVPCNDAKYGLCEKRM